MKIVIKRIITLLILLIVFIFVLNFWGVSIKLSKDYRYAVVVLPQNLSMDSFRIVNITVFSLTGEKTSWELSAQRREHFRSCYWGDDEDLWIDGEFGIILNRYENGEWKEYPVIGMEEGDILFTDCKGAQGSISQEKVPSAIIRR